MRDNYGKTFIWYDKDKYDGYIRRLNPPPTHDSLAKRKEHQHHVTWIAIERVFTQTILVCCYYRSNANNNQNRDIANLCVDLDYILNDIGHDCTILITGDFNTH
eukprot:750003_1